jgi:hypothetical protein
VSKIITLSDSEAKLVISLCRNFSTLSDKESKKCKTIIDKLEMLHKRITVQSAKAKGRNLQKWVLDRIAYLLDYVLPNDKDISLLRSREMGQNGTDIVIAEKLREKFPYAVECKNCEKINLFQFITQAKKNVTVDLPFVMLILHNKQIKTPLFCIEFDGLAHLFNKKDYKE